MPTNYKQLYAIQKKNEQRIKEICPSASNESGIYLLRRTDENGIHYFYVGQSVRVLSRLASHLSNFQHIDLSLKKRGFFSKDNPYGWQVEVKYYPPSELDKQEQYWILYFTKLGWQARYNKTAGGQLDKGEKINEYRPARGYYDGIEQGKKTLAKELRNIIDKHLIVSLKPEKANNKVSIKAFEKFKELLYGDT